MHSGIRLAAAALAIALATSVAVGAAGAHEAKAPRTLLTTRAPIRAFAQNTSRIAWVGRGWHVDVRALTGRKKILVLGSARPFPFQGNTFQALPPHVALAGARVLWTKSGGGNDLEGGVFIRKAGETGIVPGCFSSHRWTGRDARAVTSAPWLAPARP